MRPIVSRDTEPKVNSAREYPSSEAPESWSWDLGSDVLDVSAGYRRIFEIRGAAQVRPFHLLPMLDPAERASITQAVCRALSGEPIPPITFSFVRADGTRCSVRSTAALDIDAKGRPVRLRGQMSVLPASLPHGHRSLRAQGPPAISALIVGTDAMARMGVRKLLEAMPSLHVAGDYALTPELCESIDQEPGRWSAIDLLIFDVEDNDSGPATFVRTAISQWPRLRVVCRIHGPAIPIAGAMAMSGASRLVTADSGPTMLAEAVAGLVTEVTSASVDSVLGTGEIQAFEESQMLSEMERRVIRMLALGHRNREIAETLFLSEPTVKRYTRQIYRKLGARDRAHAAALAHRLRLV